MLLYRSRKYIVACIVALVAVAAMPFFVLAAADATTFVIAAGVDPTWLGMGGTDSNMNISYRIHGALFTMNNNWEAIPDVAQSWEISEDGLTYTFHLNPSARFHDNSPVTAEDVKFSIEEIVPEFVAVAWRGLIPAIDSIETPDEHTVVFHLKHAFPEMLNGSYGVGPRCYIVKKALYEGTDYATNPYNLDPVGCGPFKFVEWVRGSHIILERWEDYWGEKPAIERIVYRIIPDVMATALAFENGEIDWVPYRLVQSEVEHLNSLPGREAAYHEYPSSDVINLRFNLRRELFQDSAVRTAFAYAINRQNIADLAFFGGAIPAEAFVMESAFTASYRNPNVARQPSYDPELAKTLLDRAGYPVGEDGWRFHITLKTNTFISAFVETGELIKSDLAAVGIDVELEPREYSAWIADTFVSGNFDTSLSGFCTGPGAPALGWFTTSFIKPIPWSNDMAFSHIEYDILFEGMLKETDEERRREMLYRIQDIVVQEQPMVFLVHKMAPSAWNSERFVAPPGFWDRGFGYNYMRCTGIQPVAP